MPLNPGGRPGPPAAYTVPRDPLPAAAPRWSGDPATWGHRHPAGRAVSLVVGLGALGAAVALGGARDKVVWICAVAPDTALLIGIAGAPTWHRMPSYAVRPYNLLHSPAVPAVLLAAAALTGRRRLTVAGLAWLGHIGWDRALGYGPRDAAGYVTR
ncbi:DUF4260 family protein [Streptomyces sp. H10-C2]|uniref:DUF4260 family protein n=1 Tax=unclassified Streptomyces TaxID=2593676 RepID=UPI0024BB6CC2|nr:MULTISPECIES: DUF4260 family protein [unclassified Streptomyces]MDJ0341801.1 DUF4260 family protein [Streptomyces sp. PH10-H1]MDJ0370445.1 DUF4260 family protein [Streptomyces sp. H10-C2]